MSAVHQSAEKGYALHANTYVRGRPDYPAEVSGWLRDTLCLHHGQIVVDLGAGTGKFTPYLTQTGANVIAVEPVAAMREQFKQKFSTIDIRNGTATAIPLRDSTADAVICAQAFHWFANREALAEIWRVLKPGGRLGLIWNMRDTGIDWVAELGRIVDAHEGDTPRFASGRWREAFPFDGFTLLQEARFSHGHSGTAEDVIINRVRSTSFIAALPADAQAKVTDAVRALIARTPALAGHDTVTVPYVTFAYVTQKKV